MTALKTWAVTTGKINNLFQDEHEKIADKLIVVTQFEETEFCDVAFGWARVDGEFYRVVQVGSGAWSACWSDRQQAFIVAQDDEFIQKLNECLT